MSRNNLLDAALLMGCAPHSGASPTTHPSGRAPERVAVPPAIVAAETVEAPVPNAVTSMALPVAPCVPVTDCRIVARHRVASRFARSHGFYESPAGFVASRYSNWRARGHPEDTFFVEVTASCEVGTGYYIESGRQVWLPFVQSCGSETCANSTGYYFEAIEVQHDARRFRPLGHGFYDDGTRIYDRSEVLSDDDVDRASFHACERPEDEEAWSFYPSAEDSRGFFGYGDCGDLGRARR